MSDSRPATRSLLCVGGHNAGQLLELPVEQKVVKVPYLEPLSLGVHIGGIGAPVTIPEDVYEVDVVCSGDLNFVYFLRLSTLSFDDAIGRVMEVCEELGGMRLVPWRMMNIATIDKCFNKYSELGDPYAPD